MTSTSWDLLPELFAKISLNSFDPGNSYWVDVTHINNPLSFYVRPTAYRRFMRHIQASDDPLQSTDIHIQTSVVFKSKSHKKPIRGVILFINSSEDADTTSYDIFAPDHGFVEKSIPLNNIFRSKFPNIPPLATHCKLADCKPISDTWTGKEVEAMVCYVGEERSRMFVREKTVENLTVELINSLPNDIATMLALTGYTRMGYSNNIVSRLNAPECQKHYFTFKELAVDETLSIRLQSGKQLNEFYVADKKDYISFLNQRDSYTHFTRKLKDLSVEDFVVDTHVGVYVHSSNKYERGIIKEILSDNRAQIQLVDWGNIIEEHISLLKPMSEKFYYYPVRALYCSVEDEYITDPKLYKYLYPGYEFKIQILKVGDGFSKPHIVKILS